MKFVFLTPRDFKNVHTTATGLCNATFTLPKAKDADVVCFVDIYNIVTVIKASYSDWFNGYQVGQNISTTGDFVEKHFVDLL